MPDLVLEFESQSGAVEPDELVLTDVEGRSTISDLYHFSLRFRVPGDSGLSPETQTELLRAPCLIRFGLLDSPTEISGVLTDLRMRSTATPEDVMFEATLVPRLWSATQVRRSRVFQKLDVPGIVKAVLEEHGLNEDDGYELAITGTYPESEYTVQYQETDFDFINRLMEHQGIFYFYRHLAGGESLVLADTNRAFDSFREEPVEYARHDAPPESAPEVHTLERHLRRRPASIVLRDYNWRTPRVALNSEAPADTVIGIGLHNEYGNHFKTPADGARLAQIRAEEILVDRERYELTVNLRGLAAGHRFELAGHPFGEMDQEYVVTAIEHSAQQRGTDDVRRAIHKIEAIPSTVTYRPPRRTPRPKILGLMHGFVDGEVPGTAAPIDEYGRYNVLLPFDLVGEAGGNASRRIRLAQSSSGPGFGIHFPLHIGVEVAISHLDGDPDRPVIMASPPNTETLTPVNAANPTQSKIRTQTGIRITFDDDVA